MEKMKLLVCDDDVTKFDQLQTVLGSEFEYIHIPSTSELFSYIQRNDTYHGVFLDLQFDNEDKILNLDRIVEIKSKLNPYSKYIIYTAFTVNHIDLIKDLSRLGIIDDWIDIEELRIKNKMETTKLRLLNHFNFTEDLKNGLWILHISDLHFGKQFKIKQEDVRESLVDLLINQIKSNIVDKAACKISKPSVIITSGDLTHSAENKDFEAYKGFHLDLIKALKKLSVDYPISVLTPGNHDFSWRISMIEEHNIRNEKDNTPSLIDDVSDSEYYKSLKWKPFIENIGTLQNTILSAKDNYSWWIHDYSKRLGINFFSINSAKDFTYKSKSNIAINYSLIRELEGNTKLIDKQLGILVVHHPVETWGDDKIKKELLNYLFNKLNIRIIFSGHKHRGDIIKHRIDANNQILEIQTGSAGSNESGLDTFQLPNYRIVNIKKNVSNSFWQEILSYTFSYQDGLFIIKPKDAGGNYAEVENISNYQ